MRSQQLLSRLIERMRALPQPIVCAVQARHGWWVVGRVFHARAAHCVRAAGKTRLMVGWQAEWHLCALGTAECTRLRYSRSGMQHLTLPPPVPTF